MANESHNSGSTQFTLSASSVELAPNVALFPTGLRAALQRPPKIQVTTVDVRGGEVPRTVTVRVARKPIRVFGFVFPEAPVTVAAQSPTSRPAKRPASAECSDRPARHTRIRPPTDIVKLHDRLYYLLQPPLEMVFASGEVQFPFQPFPYQLDGIAFLYPRFAAVLADEMGLGKTMQAISSIRLLMRAGEIRRVLMVCPKPLVTNWRREFAMWAPELPVAVIEGERERRQWQWEQPNAPIKIANYELLMRDRDLLDSGQLHFDLVVLDEAQRIKNRNSTTSEVVRSIPRTRGWALTGTPVENSPQDLVGIFEFLSPGYLNTEMEARRMGQMTRDYVLRRTKDAVLSDLPPKIIRDAELSLTTEQWDTYKTAEQEGIVRLNELGQELTIQHVFELVLRLKQICNFDPATNASCKFERLAADLEEIVASGQKAIVFSQWVGTLQWLRERLLSHGPLEYHGRIPSKQRDAIVEQFRHQSDKHILLMSYGAGSVGINLQFCQYVFLFDRWWNPAVEDQAINRAHRIGSAGPVVVTRMLTVDTIEERINQVLEEKRQMFATIFSETTQPHGLGLTRDEIFGLFKLRTPDGPLRDVA